MWQFTAELQFSMQLVHMHKAQTKTSEWLLSLFSWSKQTFFLIISSYSVDFLNKDDEEGRI